jgi:membrane protein DedA with SNARE-associated domain
MNEIVQQLAKHGYVVIFASVFARQLCLPIPAILVLLAAGSLAGNGTLNVAVIVGLGAIGCVSADLVWFEAGRRRGNDILHFVLRFSSKPDTTAARTKQLFTRYGAKVLLIAKFVMGLDAVAPPLAGMSGRSRLRFMSFDFVGATLWQGSMPGYATSFDSWRKR